MLTEQFSFHSSNDISVFFFLEPILEVKLFAFVLFLIQTIPEYLKIDFDSPKAASVRKRAREDSCICGSHVEMCRMKGENIH